MLGAAQFADGGFQTRKKCATGSRFRVQESTSGQFATRMTPSRNPSRPAAVWIGILEAEFPITENLSFTFFPVRTHMRRAD